MNLENFSASHNAFLEHMQSNAPNGEPFVSFDHPFLYSDEIQYKRQVYSDAMKVLRLKQWDSYRSKIGLILDSVRKACSPQVSANLLYHRSGPAGSYKALYQVESEKEVKGLERLLFDFFRGGGMGRDEFGPRFDEFADYLRRARLGSNWSFVAYLAFLADHRRYFPILPTQFERLTKYYGIEQKISGHVSWRRYALLLDLAEELKERLAEYAPIDMIGIQSYMWVVSGLVTEGQVSLTDETSPIDYSTELKRRQRSAAEAERIGLKGEHLVVEHQKLYLQSMERHDLVDRVKLVSDDPRLGYDVLSFDDRGNQIHIEVKTTVRSQAADNGFWLSDNEKNIAARDKAWRIFRVWEVDVDPEIVDLGNLIMHPSDHWIIDPSSWFVHPNPDEVSA